MAGMAEAAGAALAEAAGWAAVTPHAHKAALHRGCHTPAPNVGNKCAQASANWRSLLSAPDYAQGCPKLRLTGQSTPLAALAGQYRPRSRRTAAQKAAPEEQGLSACGSSFDGEVVWTRALERALERPTDEARPCVPSLPAGAGVAARVKRIKWAASQRGLAGNFELA